MERWRISHCFGKLSRFGQIPLPLFSDRKRTLASNNLEKRHKNRRRREKRGVMARASLILVANYHTAMPKKYLVDLTQYRESLCISKVTSLPHFHRFFS